MTAYRDAPWRSKLLAAKREELAGTVKFLFQSAEESGHGSNYYVDHGCFAGVDGAMAMHVMNEIPKGPSASKMALAWLPAQISH